MKNKIIIILLTINMLICLATKTLARDSLEYHFFIDKNGVFSTNQETVLLLNTVDAKTLVNNKIAPGTFGKFKIFVGESSDIKSNYTISFKNFNNKIPQNLKFYYLGQEIDIDSFIITKTNDGLKNGYSIDWNWSYETKDGDHFDTADSLIETFSFDITISAEYEASSQNNQENKVNKLPQTGDVLKISKNRRLQEIEKKF